MNIADLAQVLDGLATGLASGLKEREKKELIALATLFRRFPNQSISEFIKFVNETLSRERNSVPALMERICLYKQGSGETRQELEASLRSLSATDLKKLIAALGMKAGSKKDDNLQLLLSDLDRSVTNHSPVLPQAHTDLAQQINKAYELYQAIKAELRSISMEEIRARFATHFSGLPKTVLAGVLSRLGYPMYGSKEEIEALLLDNLTSIKISYDQTKQIGS